ncbi:hypothetical protein ScalyP_jg222 [Parmales sp. scaly parma]|nr:hypothetical protein ScalyP_jg222 [Parmales sp. scaly parma]
MPERKPKQVSKSKSNGQNRISDSTRKLAAFSRSRLSSTSAKSSRGREFSSTSNGNNHKFSTLVQPEPASSQVVSTVDTSEMANRFQTTIEVAVSNIFPAGFGWQSASILAETAGFSSESVNFALTTGAGDFAGVFIGHNAFYAVKKSLGFEASSTRETAETGLLLASAAFCSGAGWQPIVNVLQGLNMSFGTVFCGTWVGCGALFYGGLRASRALMSDSFVFIEEPTHKNSLTDGSLSLAIGSATAFFVGTDAVYLPSQNFLIDVVGIGEGTGDLVGCAIAGSSTALEFLTCQSAFNLGYPSRKCWND